MFDSSLCDRTLNKLPLGIHIWDSKGFQATLLVVLLSLAFFGIRWLIKPRRYKSSLNRLKVFLLLFGCTAVFPLMLVLIIKGLVITLPKDTGASADAIVVLGRGWFLYNRVDVAAELWKAGRAPRIFTSGIKDTPNMIEKLQAQGIPDRVLDGENCSLTTWENAVFTAAILKTQGVKQIILVTDAPHMWRSILVFRANGFTVIPHPTPRSYYIGTRDEALLSLREYGGIISYGWRGVLHQQDSSEADPALLNLVQQAEKYGQRQRN